MWIHQLTANILIRIWSDVSFLTFYLLNFLKVTLKGWVFEKNPSGCFCYIALRKKGRQQDNTSADSRHRGSCRRSRRRKRRKQAAGAWMSRSERSCSPGFCDRLESRNRLLLTSMNGEGGFRYQHNTFTPTRHFFFPEPCKSKSRQQVQVSLRETSRTQ